MEIGIPISMPSPETASLAYRDDWEYIRERLGWLDLRVALRLHIQDSLSAGAWAVSQGTYEDETTREYAGQQKKYELHLQSRVEASKKEGVILALPYLSAAFSLSSIEEKAILACLAVEFDRKYESLFELLQPGILGKHPTPDLIATLISCSEEERRDTLRAFRSDGIVRKYFLNGDFPSKQGALLTQPVLLEERIVRFILESGEMPSDMEGYASLIPPGRDPAPLLGNEDVQHKLRRWLSDRNVKQDAANLPLLISLWGDSGAGKKTQVVHLGSYFDESLLIVDTTKLIGTGASLRTSLQKVFREATIQQAILVLDHFRMENEAEQSERYAATATEILDQLAEMSGIVFLLSNVPCQSVDRRRRITLELEIAPLQDEQRAEAWRSLAQAYPMDDSLDWEALSARFLFTPGQMANSLRAAESLSDWKREGESPTLIGWTDMIQASYLQLNHSLGTKSKRLSPKNRWDDLILPDAQREKLQHACNHIQHKHTVYGRWGFNKKLSYGTGISLLFSGPPGTGKTMASEIVAKELDMEIYKIDLSQIISKYIGETEKNLREIFDEAQASYAVLFFDEADALFGKRSEVKDSHDKNANTEVAFLLQKMEEYRGISILATNYLQNMDEAFLRRINYVIRFPFPDEKQREVIWKHIFPAQTPLDPDIDFWFLARKLQMAGGSIKNIALTSAFLASGLRERVGMKHIFKAYQYELDKTNRALTRDDLGEYAYLYEEMTGN